MIHFFGGKCKLFHDNVSYELFFIHLFIHQTFIEHLLCVRIGEDILQVMLTTSLTSHCRETL